MLIVPLIFPGFTNDAELEEREILNMPDLKKVMLGKSFDYWLTAVRHIQVPKTVV